MQKTDAEGHAERLMAEGHEVYVRGRPLLASLLATIASQRAELEAARAVVEKSREVVRQQLGDDVAWWTDERRAEVGSSVSRATFAVADALKAYDAAKAGKAVE